MKHRSKQSGFTLVELAIVLVIIGLIIGGVLVGQDLIRAATIRSVVTDVEKINAAATTFRNKYNGLPGDLLNSKAMDFGMNTALTDANRTGLAGLGDGNNLIEACGANAIGFGCETGLFWTDLSNAGLLPYRLVAYTTTSGVAVTNMANLNPKTRLRDTALITVFNKSGRNFLSIGAAQNAALAAAGAAAAVTYTTDAAGAAVTPLEARNIDEKVDDGLPLTGTMLAIDSGTDPRVLETAVAGGANKCVNGTSYNVISDAVANAVACGVSVRTSF